MGRTGSGHTRGHRLAAAVMALGISAIGLACSSGGTPAALKVNSGQGIGAGSSSTTAALGGGGSATTAAPTAAAPANPASPTTRSTSPTTHTTSAPASHSTNTTKATTAPTPAPTNTGPQPTAPGTYSYDGSGTTTLATSSGTQRIPAATTTSLIVSGAGSTEQWSNSVTTEDLTFTGSGVFLTSETLNTGTSTISCVFASPVAYPPWPLAVGKSSSGTANCGSATLNILVKVRSQSGANFVVAITQTSGSLTVTETDIYSPSLRLPVATSFLIEGSYGTTAVSTQSSYTLA